MSKRIKKVFTNADQVLHLWANQSQSDARCRNAYFNGVNAYSYGSHYLLGRLHTVKGKMVAIVSSHAYSSTTNGHRASAMRACAHIPVLQGNPTSIPKTIKRNKTKLTTELTGFFKKRSFYSATLSDLKKYGMLNEVNTFNQFCDAVGRKKSKIKVSKATERLMIAHMKKCIARKAELDALKNDPETIERKRKATERRQALELEKHATHIQAWRDGGQLMAFMRDLTPQLIRIKGDTVETTRGAQVPLDQAQALLTRIIHGQAKSGDTIGSFTFNSQDQGLVKIGCHTIALKEAENVLKVCKR